MNKVEILIPIGPRRAGAVLRIPEDIRPDVAAGWVKRGFAVARGDVDEGTVLTFEPSAERALPGGDEQQQPSGVPPLVKGYRTKTAAGGRKE